MAKLDIPATESSITDTKSNLAVARPDITVIEGNITDTEPIPNTAAGKEQGSSATIQLGPSCDGGAAPQALEASAGNRRQRQRAIHHEAG